jgi:hypothetical protein
LNRQADVHSTIERLPLKYRPKAGNVHPVTGEPLEKCETFSIDVDIQSVELGPPPSPPDGWIYEEPEDWWDDDHDPRRVRRMTDEELTEANVAHAKLVKQYAGCGGVLKVPGAQHVSATFSTGVGDRVEGMWGGDERGWVWMRWSFGDAAHVN